MLDLLERYRATEAEMQAYVNGLPVWVNVWRGWMFLVFGAAIVFIIWKREARWLAVTMVISLFAYNLVAMYSGVGRFPSIALVIFWLPLAVYVARRRSELVPVSGFDQIYSWWLTTSLVTLVVSAMFDGYNVAYSMIRCVP